MAKKGDKLTPKQEAFCKAYIETGKAADAYRAAYDAKRMKATAVQSNAKKLLRKTPIRLRIEELQAGHQKRHENVVDRLKSEYEKLAFFDISQAIQWGETVVTRNAESGEIEAESQSVQIKSSMEMPPEIKAAIASIEQTKDGCLKVRFHDKKGALDSLAKMHGLFKDVHEHTGKGGGPIQHQTVESLSDGELDDLIRRETEELMASGKVRTNGAARH